jgi:peptidyl-prolyl cis-trans isomerase SurA
VLLLVAALAVVPACRSSAPPPAAAVSADTWATVDGRAISRSDVDKAYRRIRNLQQQPSEEEMLTAKLSLLNDLIVEDILVARAAAQKIEVPDTELDKAFTEAKKNMTPEEFDRELTSRNLTATDMRDGLRRSLLTEKLLEREVKAKVAVTDQEVTDFFNANRAQFNLPEDAIHLAQIVVTPVREAQVGNRLGDDAATPEAAAAKAQMLMERLKAGGNFQQLAADYSEDAETAVRGGDLGLMPMSALQRVPPSLREAALKAAPGSMSIVSEGGAHVVVLVVARETAGQRDLSTPGVRDRIKGTLAGRREQLLRAAYLTSVRADAAVANHVAKRVIESSGKLVN